MEQGISINIKSQDCQKYINSAVTMEIPGVFIAMPRYTTGLRAAMNGSPQLLFQHVISICFSVEDQFVQVY